MTGNRKSHRIAEKLTKPVRKLAEALAARRGVPVCELPADELQRLAAAADLQARGEARLEVLTKQPPRARAGQRQARSRLRGRKSG